MVDSLPTDTKLAQSRDERATKLLVKLVSTGDPQPGLIRLWVFILEFSHEVGLKQVNKQQIEVEPGKRLAASLSGPCTAPVINKRR